MGVLMGVLLLVSAPAFADDAGADASSKDSGVGTMASPNNPTIPLDSGMTTTTTAPPSSDSGGCSVVSTSSSASEGLSTMLGLFTAASILVLSRRRRGKR